MAVGRVVSVDQVTTKGGAPAWQVVTDYAVTDADHLTRCAMWIPRPGPFPAIGEIITWGNALLRGGWTFWLSHPDKVRRLEFMFDPNDPHLFTG